MIAFIVIVVGLLLLAAYLAGVCRGANLAVDRVGVVVRALRHGNKTPEYLRGLLQDARMRMSPDVFDSFMTELESRGTVGSLPFGDTHRVYTLDTRP